MPANNTKVRIELESARQPEASAGSRAMYGERECIGLTLVIERQGEARKPAVIVRNKILAAVLRTDKQSGRGNGHAGDLVFLHIQDNQRDVAFDAGPGLGMDAASVATSRSARWVARAV